MSNFLQTIVVLSAIGLGGAAITQADEKTPDSSNNVKQGIEIRRRFAELSQKVNESPELQALKANVEKAQAAYSEAFEAALAKEDPTILKQYRALFEARIERLQLKKARSDAVPPTVVTGNEKSATETERIAAAQQKAMLAPPVREALRKWSAAATDAEKSAAKTEYVDALREMMIEIDPSLKSVLPESVELSIPVAETGSPK